MRNPPSAAPIRVGIPERGADTGGLDPDSRPVPILRRSFGFSSAASASLSKPTFAWHDRRAALCQGHDPEFVRDVSRIFLVAVFLDTTYQLFVLRAFYPV